jgi:hypothetical protein
MSARKTTLSYSAFALDSNDLLAYLTSSSFSVDPTLVNGAGVADTNEVNVWAGAKGTFTAKVNYSASAVPATNLNVTAFTVGGTAYLGDLRSGSLKFSNPSAEGKGLADKFAYPNAVGGRSIEFTGSLLVPSATVLHALMTKAASATVSDKSVAMSLTIGSETYACNMVLGNVTHQGERGGLQELSVTMKGAAAPSSPTGTTIYGVAITGDAILSLQLDTEAGQYGTSGTPLPCFCSGLDISFSDGAIVETSLTLEVQGTPTVTTSS